MTWEDKLEEASILLESREHYQKRLGKLAAEIIDEYGSNKLIEFSEAIKETYGLSLSVSTLRNYWWCFNRTKDLDLPDDISYRTLQYISSSENPAYWAKRIKDEGLSSPEALRLLREEKGLGPKKKTVICPKCNQEIEV
jgi:hypothetical protein